MTTYDHDELFSERWPGMERPLPNIRIRDRQQYAATLKAYMNLKIAGTALAGTDGATNNERSMVWEIARSLLSRMAEFRKDHPDLPEVIS